MSATEKDTLQLPPLTLVLGGARSGKSRHAESLIEAEGRSCAYVATAQAFDAEMEARIAAHRARRGAQWTTFEAPLALGEVLQSASVAGRPSLVDCLTLWLSNLMLEDRDIMGEIGGLLALLPNLDGPLVMVSNEVGLGIVPDNALARAFRDHAGYLNQQLAATADQVVFLAAGLPLTLKSPEGTNR